MNKVKLVVLTSVMAVLTGCATTQPNIDALRQEATESLAAGANDKAIELLEQVAKSSPTDKDVWVKLAQAYLDKQDYPRAVNAAAEALARDSANFDAKSIMFVSSARLAAMTLTDLRKQDQFVPKRRGEAERLVMAMREALGDSSVAPVVEDSGKARSPRRPLVTGTPPQAQSPKVADRPVAQPASQPATVPVAVTPPKAPPKNEPAPANKNADPFGALR
ncbi:tetratricopeptide repeat protein [Chitinivorax sp. B]|uniref:tetratricopeptide repeat protein n=1 Tax=Chitinivorax sp. B TaxID=2502235 RepID=UPI0010F954AF|nr:tetratricopeptide repeat protein [Chitinivorax sp. B]